MQQPQTDQTVPASTPAEQPTEKHPYQPPELRCFGSVTQLTLGTGGIQRDGRANTRKS
ncbi:MAG TPA: hypothetical protein VFZ66_26530 [Herpetosiphonaceae bacterium]